MRAILFLCDNGNNGSGGCGEGSGVGNDGSEGDGGGDCGGEGKGGGVCCGGGPQPAAAVAVVGCGDVGRKRRQW